MTIQIGNFNIPLILIAGLIPLLLLSTTSQIVFKDKVQKKMIINKLINILFLSFLSWKLTSIFTSFKTILENPSSFLFLTGGRTGEVVSLVLSLIYLFIIILKNRSDKQLITFITIYLSISIILFISITNLSSNKLDNREIVKISNLTLQNIEKENIKIDLDGDKTIILNFWATWCPPCKAEIPELIDFYKEYKTEVDFYGINLIKTEKGDISNFLNTSNINFPIYLDQNSQVSNYFDIKSIPSTIVIFKKGDELYMEKHTGVITKDTLRRFISKRQ